MQEFEKEGFIQREPRIFLREAKNGGMLFFPLETEQTTVLLKIE